MNKQYERDCPRCGTTLYYAKIGQRNAAVKNNRLCRTCADAVRKEKTKIRHEQKKVELTCKFCNKKFYALKDAKYRRFCSKECVREWRKYNSHEIKKCLNCGQEFKAYKFLEQRYCSNECNRTSIEKREKLKIWANSDANPRKSKEVNDKIKETMLERYGTKALTNIDKIKETTMKNHGVPYAFNKCRGKISKIQKQYYEHIKVTFPDAKLEYYLKDVELFADIYIPSINKVIEIQGDFWHMNPKQFNESYVNPVSNIVAKDKWDEDKKRKHILENAGYNVKIIWESELK